MTDMAERIEIVSAERIRDELDKLICGAYPREGLRLLVETGLAAHVLPELPKLRLEIDEHHRHKDVYEHTLTVLDQAIAQEDDGSPTGSCGWAALLHDIGKPKTRRHEAGGRVSFHHHEVVGAQLAKKRMTELRFPKDVVADVSRLVELHLRFHGYGTGEWTDSAVRRYVRDAGHLLDRLHKLTRADCTTRNKRKATALSRTYDQLEERIARLAERGGAGQDPSGARRQRDPADPRRRSRPDRRAGVKFLLELRLDKGMVGKETATEALLEWARDRAALSPAGDRRGPDAADQREAAARGVGVIIR